MLQTPLVSFLLPSCILLLLLLSKCHAFGIIVQNVGEVALDNVEGLASVIADSSGRAEVVNTSLFRIKKGGVATGLGGSVMESTLDAMDDAHKTDPQVWKALANLERDSECYFIHDV